MAETDRTVPAGYFDQLYSENIDPWQFRSSIYEHDKYIATVGALRKPVYESALEAGCAIGVLTGILAPRCKRLLAFDGSVIAIEAARKLQLNGVRFEVRQLPTEFPDGQFDLIVLSELLYYLSAEDLNRVAERCASALAPDGDLVLCHWLGDTNYPLTGVAASEMFAAAVQHRLPHRQILHDDVYRLELLAHA